MDKRKLLLAGLFLIAAFAIVQTVKGASEADTTDWKLILEGIISNPLAMGAIITLVWNLGGYIQHITGAKALEKYELIQLVETLVLFETVFIAVSGVAGLPTSWSTVIGLIVAVVRSLKKAFTEAAEKLVKTA